MAVENARVVDAVGTDRETGEIILTVLDALPWNDANHLALLQGKLEHYLTFIRAGELVASYPDARGKPLRIDVVCRFAPSSEGVAFLTRVKGQVRSFGSNLSWRVHAA